MTPESKKNILIILSLGLGDMFFSLPSIRAIKENNPDAKLTFLTNAKNAEVLQWVPGIDKVLTYPDKSVSSLFNLIAAIRRSAFDLVFVLNPIFKGSLVAFLSGAKTRIGYREDYEKKQSLYGLENILLTHRYLPRQKPIHEAERYLDLLRFYGLNVLPGEEVPKIHLQTEKYPLAENIRKEMYPGNHKGPLILINLGAAWRMRLWPKERICGLADWLIAHFDARIIFVGGKSEETLADWIEKQLTMKTVANFAGKISLGDLAKLFLETDLFITPDTGTLHLAAALDVPTIALFGPGNLTKVRPLSSKVKVLYHQMSCSPCRFQYTDKCQNNLCMKEITLDEVCEQAAAILGRHYSGPLTVMGKTQFSKKKILYLQSTSEVGGTDVTLLRTLQALDQTKYEPHVLLSKEGPFAGSYRALGCRVHIMPWMKKITRRKGILYILKYLTGYFPAVFRLARFIRREGIALVHTNTIHNPYGFLSAKLARVRHVWHIREIVVQSRWVRMIEVFLVKHFSDKFLVMDNAIGEAFLGRNHGFPKNIAKIYDGVNLEKFSPQTSGERIRKALGIPQDCTLVGIVCRLDPWKGLDIFVEAAREVYEKDQNTRFLICGGEIEGHEGYEAKLKEKAQSLGLEAVIYFTGWRYFGEDIPEIYAALDVSVQCPRYPEPYGLANIEAMASGVPHVSINQGGPVELCEEGKTGFLVPADNPQAVADAVLKIAQNAGLAKSMGKRGRQRAEKFFDFQKCTREIEKIYAEVLNK